MIELEDGREIRSEITRTQWPNYVMFKQYLTEDMETDGDSDVSWEWEIETVWIRLS